MDETKKKLFRCAIYTRKSTEHNLDLEFNSLDAQREACEAWRWRNAPTATNQFAPAWPIARPSTSSIRC